MGRCLSYNLGIDSGHVHRLEQLKYYTIGSFVGSFFCFNLNY